MHIVIDFYVLDYDVFVSLQPAVEVVQVRNAGEFACCSVEQLGRDGFRQRVVALFLPTGHEVITVFGDHPVQFGNLVGAVLQVSVHRDDHISLCPLETTVQTGGFAVITTELDRVYHFRVLAFKGFDHFPGVVRASVIDKNYFVTEIMFFHHPLYPCKQFWKRLGFIVQWYNY